MIDFEEKLSKAISMCNMDNVYKQDFAKIYTFTTENISGYLKYFDLENKSLLTVGSSGDQVLNAYLEGCRDITLVDINEFAKFYLYLKISAIMTLDYKGFKDFFFKCNSNYFNIDINKNMFSKKTFDKFKSTLRLIDYESYLFFDELFNTFSSSTIRKNLMNDDVLVNSIIKGFNKYLKNEENYNLLQKMLKKELHKLKFNYINEDILKFDSEKRYDNIFLSNISKYITLNDLECLVMRLNENLNEKMLFSYIYQTTFDKDKYDNSWCDIYKMPIVREKFKSYIDEYYEIYSEDYYVRSNTKVKDLVLINRKKGCHEMK